MIPVDCLYEIVRELIDGNKIESIKALRREVTGPFMYLREAKGVVDDLQNLIQSARSADVEPLKKRDAWLTEKLHAETARADELQIEVWRLKAKLYDQAG